MLAHELRSPMTAILGWIQMLQMGGLTTAETTSALRMIETSTRVRAHIVEDLMDVSRILAGKIMIAPSLTAMAPVVRNAVETFRPAAIKKNIDLEVEIPHEPMIVYGDEARLQQVVWNLLSNAIKFTPSGGWIKVTLARRGARSRSSPRWR